MYEEIERKSRKYPLNMPKNWDAPYPTFTSNISKEGVCLQIIGCQYSTENDDEAKLFIKQYIMLIEKFAECDNFDVAQCKDNHGLNQILISIYWLNFSKSQKWISSSHFKDYWKSCCQQSLAFGIFNEQFNIEEERFETIQSGPDHTSGAAISRTSIIKEPIDLHGYWGAMRDRLPISTDDSLASTGEFSVFRKSENHYIVKPSDNFCMIRSGQDWSQAEGEERQEYIEDIAPILKKGMDFLSNDGAEVNCIANRFMRYVDQDDFSEKEHSFGLAYFKSLEDLEYWSKEHPTHLAIFGSFFKFAPKYAEKMKSRFWHEVAVIEAKNVIAEYYNCRENTGLLGNIAN